MSFPNNLIKGVPNKDFLTSDGSVGAHLFYFDGRHNRPDGWCEQSINWDDDEHAIRFTLNQVKEDSELQFKMGVVTVARNGIERINGLPSVSGVLSYERRPLEHNNYHGNLLILANVRKDKMRMIAASIALASSKVISLDSR